MENKKSKTVGIIGGMGPLATIDLMKKIVSMTDACIDQEHVHVITDCNTHIPDRTKAILNGGESPLEKMAESAVKLESIGADMIIMACNTAHYFYDDVCKFVKIPIINMITETIAEVKALGYKTVGLLATDGTIKSGIYEKAFTDSLVKTITPSKDGQNEVMRLIYDVIKAGKADVYKEGISPFINEISSMKQSGVEVFILGCTELPPAFELFNIEANYLDPTVILARRAVELSGKRVF